MVKVLTKIRYHVKSGFRHGFKNVIFSKFFFGFVASLGVLISSHDKAGRIRDNLNARLGDQEDTFDFIIVGAGTAGCLLANRLSEQHKVLLLEAGGEPHPLQRIPGMAFFMVNYRETDWMHRTVPQRRACFSSPGRRAGWCQGRNLGGTGNLNYMVHMRGSPRDYDNWAKVTGDESWSYEALLHYFRRHENYQGDSPDREAHGFDGDMMLETPSYTGMAKEFIRAGQELGYEHVDLNARFEEGFDSIYSPMEQGERKSSFSAFLEPVRERETLVVRKYSRVNKILIRSFDNTAFGVEYDRHGSKKYGYATKEVILSAGAVESPKLLMMSGIGPRTHLADLGIPVVADLPVGKNLQDHLAVILGPFFVDPPRSFLIDRDITLKSFYEYKSDGNGPLSSSIFHAAAMISSKTAKHTGVWNWPDILMLMSGMAGHKTFARDMSHAFNLNQKLIKKYYHHASGRDSFIIFVAAARPQGRGDITLEKKDAYSPPSINPHYLENEHDMEITIEGIKTALYLVENTTSFQNLRARFTNKKFPGCDHMPFRSDDYWQCYIRHFSVSLNDAAGSCAMGNPVLNDFGTGSGWGKELQGLPFVGAVVDAKLQVIGINHLRVADASVMPTITGSQTNAGVMVIAEKCADMINEGWAGNENGPPPTTYKPFGWGEQMPSTSYGPPEGGYSEGNNGNQQGGYGDGTQSPPPQNSYGPPASNSYGPPAQSSYGPPPQPPQQESQGGYGGYTAPQSQYGPPTQSQQGNSYGPPAQGGYGGQAVDTSYGPPNTEPSPDTSYGPPETTTMMGYTDPTTEMSTGGDESNRVTNTFSTEGSTTTPQEMTTFSSTPMSTEMSSTYNTEAETGYMDSMPDTTTLAPAEQYGPPNTQYGAPSSQYGAPGNQGGFDNSQNGFPTQEYGPPGSSDRPPPLDSDGYNALNEINSDDNNNNNNNNENTGEPPIFLTPPGLPGDTTTMASTSIQTSSEGYFQPQLGNPIFGGFQDPRNIPPAGDSDLGTTFRSNGVDPPEENAPAGGAFDPVTVDSATSESTINGMETSTFKSFFKDGSGSTESPTGFGGTAASRPSVDFLNHDTKLRPGLQISNPFPDMFYATSSQQQGDIPEDSFFQKYPITSSVEFANNKPNPPKLDSVYFRNPEFTTRRPILFGSMKEPDDGRPPASSPPRKFNSSAVAASRQSDNTPPAYTPYYNDRNRRPDEGTVKPTVLYKSVGATNKIPSTANVPNIYYSVKDKVSKEGEMEEGGGGKRIPVMFAPSGPPPPSPVGGGGGIHLKTQIPTGPSGPNEILKVSSSSGLGSSANSGPSGFGGSAQGSMANSYWTNASPKPPLFQDQSENSIQVEIKDDSSYWTNASPKPPLLAMPRGMDNAIQVDSFGAKQTPYNKNPGRIRALRRKPKEEPTDTSSASTERNGKRRIVRIKSDMIWTTTQRPAVLTTFSPVSGGGPGGNSGKMRIRVKTKEALMEKERRRHANPEDDLDGSDELMEDTPVLSPYWSQSSTTTVSTTSKPGVSISGTSAPTTAVYVTTNDPAKVSPRPMLNVQLWPSGKNKDVPAPDKREDLEGYLAHPGFDSEGKSQDDQDSSSTYLLTSIANAISRGRRRRPHKNNNNNPHFEGPMSTGRPAYAASGNSATRFMISTQVPDLFVQDELPEEEDSYTTTRDHRGLETTTEISTSNNNNNNDYRPSRKKFTAHDAVRHSGDHNHHHDHHIGGGGEGGGHHHFGHGGEGIGSVEIDSPFLPPPRGFNDGQPNNVGGGSGPAEFDRVPPPHEFDSGERNRFNFFESTPSPSGPPPPPPAQPTLEPYRDRHRNHPPPPPPHQEFQVTTPGNDFSSPAYDENPLQFFRDATPLAPNRFQDPTNKPGGHGQREFGGGDHQSSRNNDVEGLFPPGPPEPQPSGTPNLPSFVENSAELNNFHIGNQFGGGSHEFEGNNNQNRPPPNRFPTPTPSPGHFGGGSLEFQDNSNKIPNRFPTPTPIPGHFGGGSLEFQENQNNNNKIPNRFATPSSPAPPSHFGGSHEVLDNHQRIPNRFASPTPTPGPDPQLNFRAPPPPPPPDFRQVHHHSSDAFGLGHSSPVGMGGGNSPAPAKGMNDFPDFRHNQPAPPPPPIPQLPQFEDHPRVEHFAPPPRDPPHFDDLGQIPDIFGFRDVVQSSPQPPSGPPPQPQTPTAPSPSQASFQDEFGNPFGFSSPPTTALQQSIHNILTGPGTNGFSNQNQQDQQHHQPPQKSVGLPSPPGTLGLPTYLGEEGPKMFEDGVDPNKISLTYDDTGTHDFLDPPVIHNQDQAGGKNNLDASQISITAPQQQNNNFQNHDTRMNVFHNQGQNSPPSFHNHQGQSPPNNFQNEGHHQGHGQNQRPTLQFEESRDNPDVTQTRDQILSNFGPQKDPDDFPDLIPASPFPHRQPTRKPFGSRNKERQRNPFAEFDGLGGDFNPFAELMTAPQKNAKNHPPQPPPPQNFNQNQAPPPPHQHQHQRQPTFNPGPSSPPPPPQQHHQPVFNPGPSRSPPPQQTHHHQQVNPHHANPSAAPPPPPPPPGPPEFDPFGQLISGGPSTPAPGGFGVTPFDQPDFTRFDIPTPSNNNNNNPGLPFQQSTAPPPVDMGGPGKPQLKEYTIYTNPDDVDITIDQVGGRGNLQAPNFDQNVRRRSDNLQQRRRKRRKNQLKALRSGHQKRGGRAVRLRPIGGSSRGNKKRYYMLRPDNSTTTPVSTEKLSKRASEEGPLSSEMLSSFMGMFGGGGGGIGASGETAMMEQLLRNSSIASLEDEVDDDNFSNESGFKTQLEEEELILSSISGSTARSVPDWNAFEAATTNATILLGDNANSTLLASVVQQQLPPPSAVRSQEGIASIKASPNANFARRGAG